ncbi:MAG: baseplate J/gp47 family protein [Filifactoraceae bacterium]
MSSFNEIQSRKMANDILKNLDTREGSIIWTATAANSLEQAELYRALEIAINDSFIWTASRDRVIMKAAERNIYPYPATSAVIKVKVTPDIDITGQRFAINEVVFTAREKLEDGKYKLVCEQTGEKGNISSGQLIPIDYIPTLEKIEVESIVVYGEEEESTESIVKRYTRTFVDEATSGNLSHYLEWIDSFAGIGAVRIKPLRYGGNTVGITITNTEMQEPSEILVKELQDFLDPGGLGLGLGKAPIGAKVTVIAGTPKNIDVVAKIRLADGYLAPKDIDVAIKEYLKSITYVMDYVSYFKVVDSVIDCECVKDLIELTVNGGSFNIALTDDEIPTLNDLQVVVDNG